MTLNESTIYRGLTRLRKVLYRAQFATDKTTRKIHVTPMLLALREALGYFVMAFEVIDKTERANYMSKCIGAFYVVRSDLDFMMEENLFHFAKYTKRETVEVDGRTVQVPLTTKEAVEEQQFSLRRKVEIYELIADIDRDICKYNNSISRGKTIVG